MRCSDRQTPHLISIDLRQFAVGLPKIDQGQAVRQFGAGALILDLGQVFLRAQQRLQKTAVFVATATQRFSAYAKGFSDGPPTDCARSIVLQPENFGFLNRGLPTSPPQFELR